MFKANIILNLGKALNKAEQKEIGGGQLQHVTETIVSCNNGYDFSVNPEGAFNPNQICAEWGGFSHMTYIRD